jgi:hypothetical protein
MAARKSHPDWGIPESFTLSSTDDWCNVFAAVTLLNRAIDKGYVRICVEVVDQKEVRFRVGVVTILIFLHAVHSNLFCD